MNETLPPETRFYKPRSAKHGTRSRYNNNGCRCEACAKANRAYSLAQWYKKRKAS